MQSPECQAWNTVKRIQGVTYDVIYCGEEARTRMLIFQTQQPTPARLNLFGVSIFPHHAGNHVDEI